MSRTAMIRVALAHVLGWIISKLRLAAGAAEKNVLAFVAGTVRRVGADLHAAHGVGVRRRRHGGVTVVVRAHM